MCVCLSPNDAEALSNAFPIQAARCREMEVSTEDGFVWLRRQLPLDIYFDPIKFPWLLSNL